MDVELEFLHILIYLCTFQIRYKKRLMELHSDSSESESVHDDPGLLVWKDIVGGVKRGRLTGRPRERWSSRGASSSTYLLEQKTQEVQRLREELQAVHEVNASQAVYNAKQHEFMKMMVERYNMPMPPPSPPAFTRDMARAPVDMNLQKATTSSSRADNEDVAADVLGTDIEDNLGP